MSNILGMKPSSHRRVVDQCRGPPVSWTVPTVQLRQCSSLVDRSYGPTMSMQQCRGPFLRSNCVNAAVPWTVPGPATPVSWTVPTVQLRQCSSLVDRSYGPTTSMQQSRGPFLRSNCVNAAVPWTVPGPATPMSWTVPTVPSHTSRRAMEVQTQPRSPNGANMAVSALIPYSAKSTPRPQPPQDSVSEFVISPNLPCGYGLFLFDTI